MQTFTTRTTNYTAAASNAAPPGKRSMGTVLIVVGVVIAAVAAWAGYWVGTTGASMAAALIVGIGVLVGIAVVVVALPIRARDAAYNRDVYFDDYDEWERSWQCLRCGTTFVV